MFAYLVMNIDQYWVDLMAGLEDLSGNNKLIKQWQGDRVMLWTSILGRSLQS